MITLRNRLLALLLGIATGLYLYPKIEARRIVRYVERMQRV